MIGVIAHVDEMERDKSPKKHTESGKRKSVLEMRKTVARIIDYGEFRFLSYHFWALGGFSWDEKPNYDTVAKMWRAESRKPPPQIMFINTFFCSSSSRALAVR